MEPIPRRAKPVAQRSGRWLLAGRASAKLLSCFGCPLLAPPQNNVPPTRYPARRVAGGKRAARESGKIVDGGGSPAGQARGLRRAWLTRGVGMHLLFFEQAPGSWRLHMRKETPPGEDGRGRTGSSRCLSRRALSGVGLLQLTRARRLLTAGSRLKRRRRGSRAGSLPECRPKLLVPVSGVFCGDARLPASCPADGVRSRCSRPSL